MPIEFEHPEYLVLLLLLLPVATLWYWWQWRKRRIIEGLATSPTLLQTLLKNYHPARARYQLISILLIVSAIVLALMNPMKEQERVNEPMNEMQAMLLVDVSNSMLAADVAPNRLERARTFSMQLAERFSGNRLGLLAFAGEARIQMPPTSDLSAIKLALQTLSPLSVPMQGTNIEAALKEADRSLSSDALAGSAMVLVTDGEELEGNVMNKIKEIARKGVVLHVIGVGSPQGALLTEPETGQPILDSDDRQVLSRKNEPLLKDLAKAGKGIYADLNDIPATVEKVRAALSETEKTSSGKSNLVNYFSFSPFLLALALIFLLWDLFGYHLPGKIQNRIISVALGVMCFISPNGSANGQKPANSVEAVLETYRAGQWKECGEILDRLMQKSPADARLRFFKGLTLYQQKKWQEAAFEFSDLALNSPENEYKALAFNNAGLALVQANNLPQAIEMWKQAARIQPEDPEIRHNLQKALIDLEKQKPDAGREKQPPPPMKEEDAERKLQSILDEERRTRERIRQKRSVRSHGKNW